MWKRNTPFHQLIAIFIFVFSLNTAGQPKLSKQHVGLQDDGSILVPSNQFLRPAGLQVPFPGRPVDICITKDEQLLIIKNSNSLDLLNLHTKKVVQSLPFERSGASFTGLCLSKDESKIYVTSAENLILVAQLNKSDELEWIDSFVLPGPQVSGYPVPGGIALSENEDKIYVTLSRNNSLASIDLTDSSIIEIPTGIAPYDVLLFSGEKAYVSNWGGRRPLEGESAYNSSGSKVLVDPKTGIANNGSVTVVNLKRNEIIKEIEVGLHPSGMVLNPDKTRLYVACANSDIISVVDTKSEMVIEEISVRMNKRLPFGSAPNALTISQDGKTLYVANGTDNAICVIKTGTPSQVIGFIPVGWYPGSVIMNQSGKVLYVANVKGTGSRNQIKEHPAFNSHDHLGTVSVIPVPNRLKLNKLTKIVQDNNFLHDQKPAPGNEPAKVAVPSFPGQSSLIKHVVYIIKENRTYDQIFGDIPQGNGDTSLVEFGYNITPNHHLLAESFVLMDNFNCSGVLSADGHQWTDEAYVTDYIEKSFGDFTRSYPYDGDDALAYASSGFIWDNVLSHGLTFRNYGEFVDAIIDPPDAEFSEIYSDYITGENKISIRSKVKLEQLEAYTCPSYISFPCNVPDVYRASEFIKELDQFEESNNFPNFIILSLPNDHTSGTVPGFPTPRAAVADNDLALGMIIEAISNSKFWNETCIFVTEDDPQDGLDHVDGHRTVGLVVSPYTKRKQVISTYYSQINMVRTIENILGIPPMNQLDLSSEAMFDCFQNTPDFEPYKAVMNNIPLDEINPPIESLQGAALYWAQKSMEQDLDDYDRIDEDIFNRIIWHATKGYEIPYPILE